MSMASSNTDIEILEWLSINGFDTHSHAATLISAASSPSGNINETTLKTMEYLFHLADPSDLYGKSEYSFLKKFVSSRPEKFDWLRDHHFDLEQYAKQLLKHVGLANNIDVLDWLIEKKLVELDKLDAKEWDALLRPVLIDWQFNFVERLLELGADVNLINPINIYDLHLMYRDQHGVSLYEANFLDITLLESFSEMLDLYVKYNGVINSLESSFSMIDHLKEDFYYGSRDREEIGEVINILLSHGYDQANLPSAIREQFNIEDSVHLHQEEQANLLINQTLDVQEQATLMNDLLGTTVSTAALMSLFMLFESLI